MARGYLQRLANDQGIFWPSLKQDTIAVTLGCHQCHLFNQHVPSYAPLNPLLAKKPFTHVVIDLIGPFPVSPCGNVFTLILVDVCTRFVLLKHYLTNLHFVSVLSCSSIFLVFGFPQIIQSV